MGRDTELGSIRDWLDQRLPVEIYGEPGIGKSTLLRRVAAERGSLTDVVYLSASGLAREDLLQEIFQAFYDVEGYRPEPVRMRRLLGSVQALLVLDDYEGSPEDLAAVLDAVPSCDVLLAGARRHLFGDGQVVALHGLGEDDARVVLTRHLGRRLTSDESEAAGRLWDAAHGNPRVLVQTAVAVRSLWDAEPDGDLPRISLDAAEPALAPVLAGRLGEDARRVLMALAALGGDVPVCRPALVAMSGVTEAGVEELLAAGLVEDAGTGGCRLAGSLGGAVAGHAGDLPAVVDLAAGLTRWVGSASPQGVAHAAPVIVRMLDRLIAASEPGAAVRLARAAAPRVALSLRWDAWSQVLSRGRAAAHLARATADEAYFAREEEVRRRVLAWGAVGAAGGAAAATLGTGGLHGADTSHVGSQAASPPPRPSQPLRRKVLAHPATTAVAVTIVVTATVGLLRLGFSTQNASDALPVTTLAPSSVLPSAPLRSKPSLLDQSLLPTVTVSISVSPSAMPCVPGGPAVDFGSVPAGSRKETPHSFYSDVCHTDGLDTAHMAILGSGATAFSLTRSSCPDVLLPGHGTCYMTITFAPRSTGRFEATLFVPEAGAGTGGHGESPVVGVGIPPTTVAVSPTAAPTPTPTPTLRTVTVGSGAGWVDAGILMTTGDQVRTEASGAWTADGSFTRFGPNGSATPWPDNYLNLADIGVCGSCATTNTRNWAALVGYIGNRPPPPGSYTSTAIRAEAEKVFVLSGSYNGTAQQSGRLWLSINDNAYYGNLSDNTGSMTVDIAVTPG